MIAVNTNKCLQVYSQERDGNTDAKLTEDSDSLLPFCDPPTFYAVQTLDLEIYAILMDRMQSCAVLAVTLGPHRTASGLHRPCKSTVMHHLFLKNEIN